MASRQDQLHSYQFVVQRVVSALVSRETVPTQSPFRRLAGATLAGVLVAALSLAAVAVYGVIMPGGATHWQEAGAVIVEKETGARYVYLAGRLHPVLNYASALLILGSPAAHTVAASRHSLRGVPRAAPLGIAGAPDSLPEAAGLLGPPWTVCGSPAGSASVHIGASPAGGHLLGPDEALLVRAPHGDTWLLWRGHRHRLGDFALGALAWRGEPAGTAAPALLDATPQGADLAGIPIPERGEGSRASFARVGQVFVVRPQGGAPRYTVALSDGLATISQVQANLLLGDPRAAVTQGRAGAIELSPARYTAAPVAGSLIPAATELAPPQNMPRLVHPSTVDGSVCAVVAGATGLPALAVDVPPAASRPAGASAGASAGVDPAGVPADPAGQQATGADPGVPAGGAAASGAVRADRVLVEPGRGAVVESLASPDAASGTLSLITDQGVRFAVPNLDVLGTLGYPGATPIRLPAGLVALLPAGPALDPAAARRAATAGG